MIRIIQVRFDNFLSFRGTVLIENIAPISVFVGPNNSGKSNIIRCLKFYQGLAEKSKILEYISYDDIKRNQHRLSTFNPLSIEIKYAYENKDRSTGPLEMTHLISYSENGQFNRETLLFKKQGREPDNVLQIFTVELNGTDYVASLQYSESVSAFLSNMRPPRTPGLERTSLSRNKPFGWDWAKSDNLGLMIYGELIQSIERWIFVPGNRVRNDTEKFLLRKLGKERNKTNRMFDLLFDITETNDINIDGENDKIQTLVRDIPGEENQVDLDQFGSGYEQILILLKNIYKGYNDDTIFFIDEPELHLHPHYQRKLLQHFIERRTNNQFFLITHSTIFCRQQDGVLHPYLTKKDKEKFGTQIEIIGKDKMEDIKSILGHVNSDLFGNNAVLLVEGQTEEGALPLLANNMEFDIFDYGIRIINFKGYGKMHQVENIIDLLKNSGTGIYAIYDSHQDTQGKLEAILSELPSENIAELDREFEECFSNEILTEALCKLLSQYDRELNDEERNDILQKLSSRTKSAFRVLAEYYFETADYSLPKIDLGKAIASVVKERDEILKSKPEQSEPEQSKREQSKPELLLDRIRKDIDNRLRLTHQ
jgi:predicted ATP-dependent endonuclease of OLD family